MKRLLIAAMLVGFVAQARSQTTEIQPRIVTLVAFSEQVTVAEVARHFVTSIRAPEAVSSVVVGDPSLFQVEHSEREPQLVFVKVLTSKAAETNLLISTTNGHQLSVLLVSRGDTEQPDPKVDFMLNYRPERSFVIDPAVPSFAIRQTVPLSASRAANSSEDPPSTLPYPESLKTSHPSAFDPVPMGRKNLDELLLRQESAQLPELYGERPKGESTGGERIRAGVGEVIDRGQDVIVMFSVVNPQGRDILVMPPQVQLGGKTKRGKLMKHSRWTTAEQLPVVDFRLSKRRLAAGERADGVVLFERPPYKLSSETLFLQMSEAGAIDQPALAPIGFGINVAQEKNNDKTE